MNRSDPLPDYRLFLKEVIEGIVYTTLYTVDNLVDNIPQKCISIG